MAAEIINKAAAPNILIVDPNPPGSGMHPPENMFIYVKFVAHSRDRSLWVVDKKLDQKGKYISQENQGVLGEINFIATQINYDEKSGKPNPGQQKTYATTNYTNIGGLSDENSRGVLEGFGVKSIDIKYNASLVPTVDITFTDVRGAALFDTISAENRRSPYSIFFKMPYPIFELSIKGYFGKTVNYCLHMINWTSNFDGTTGNFDISANFIGFQQAFLNDMVLGNIIGVVNTQEGLDILNGLFDEEEAKLQQLVDDPFETVANVSGNLIPEGVRKIDNLFVKISKLQIDFENFKDELREFDELRAKNTQKNKLKRIQTFIGPPLIKVSKFEEDDDYESIANKPDYVLTSVIEDNSIDRGKEYLSIRDFIVFKSIVVRSIREYFITLNEIIQDYKAFIFDNEWMNETENTDLINSFHSIGSDENYKQFLIAVGSGSTEDTVSLEMVFNYFEVTDGGILTQSYDGSTDGSNPNASFRPMEFFSARNRANNMGLKGEFHEKNNVQVLDLRKCRAKVEKMLIEVNEVIEIQKRVVEEELNKIIASDEGLGFNPTIRNIFRIICNNTQAMLDTITKKSQEAQNSGNQDYRRDILRRYTTDISDKTGTAFAWPSIYETQDGKGEKEIYIGEVRGMDGNIFPEFDFVEKVYKNLVARQKKLNQITKATQASEGNDTDNWYPINPLDYTPNPFLNMNNINTKTKLVDEMAKQLFLRTTVLNTYSQFGGKLSDYARFDGINANKSIFSQLVRNFIKENLTEASIIDSAKKQGILQKNSNNLPEIDVGGTDYYILDEGLNQFSMGGYKVSGYRTSSTIAAEVDYIIFDKSKIINNAKKLWREIQKEKSYKSITKKKEGGRDDGYINYYDSSNNYISQLSYYVWDKNLTIGLVSGKTKIIDYKVKDIKKIDLNDNINVFYPNKGGSATPKLSKYLIDSDFYSGQTTPGKALLLLSTLPFKTFKEAVLSTLTADKRARIIELPIYYIYFIGGLLWRISESVDPIKWVGYPDLKTEKYDYFTNLGAMNRLAYKAGTKQSTIEIEDALIKLPERTKNQLISKFTVWSKLQGHFKNFERLCREYKTDSGAGTDTKSEKAGKGILKLLLKETKMILPTPMILFPDDTSPENLTNGLLIKVDDFTKYFKVFKEKFVFIDEENDKGEESSSENETDKGNKSEIAVKLMIYNYFKNINNKWACSENVYNTCGPGGSLINSFKFINRGWGDIGNTAVINLNSLLTIANNLNTSIYFFISKILRDSNFLFQILPNYINFKDRKEVQDIFTPIVNVSDENNGDGSGPAYVCIFVGGNSEVLDIKEENKYYFPNDGYSFTEGNDIPADIDPDSKNKLVAFRVAFGSENQTIFKNVSLSQQEHRETAEYFRVLAEIIDKRGGTQRTYQGNDLLQLFKTRSYVCKIEALGCMNIQPLMYFDLQNVPFFNGAYLITGVNHNITANHMTTSFTGLRQSKFTTLAVDTATSYLNIDLNEDLNFTPVEFSNQLTASILYSIGLKDEAVDQPFIDENNPGLTVPILRNLGVTDTKILDSPAVIPGMNKIMLDNGIITNSQALMFLSNVLANSNNMGAENREEGWSADLEDFIIYETLPDGKPDVDTPLQYNNDDKDIKYDPPGTSTQKKYRPKNDIPPFTVPQGDLAKDLGNTEPGDGYRYRPRGYLYINGKTQYDVAFGGTYLNNPDAIQKSPLEAFRVAAFVWSNVQGKNKKTSNIYAKGSDKAKGNSASFEITVNISQKTDDSQKSFEVFEKVLSIYNVLAYNKP